MKIRELPQELREKAKKELNEDRSRMVDGLNSMREWLKFQKHLKYKDDDQFLLAFLRGCKYSLERVKIKLDFYYTSRTLASEFFTGRSPFNTSIQKVLKNNIVSIYSPKLTFPTVCICSWYEIEQNNISLEDMIQHCLMAFDLLLNEEDECVINGLIIILDYKDVSLKHIVQYNISNLKKYFVIIQNAYPIRIKGFCVINAPPMINTLFNMLDVVLSKKIKKRIHVYNEENNYKLFDIVPQMFLPTKFGGTFGSVSELTEAWRKRLESYSDFIKEEDQYRSIEELRVGQPKTHSDVFGQEGSFRQLGFD